VRSGKRDASDWLVIVSGIVSNGLSAVQLYGGDVMSPMPNVAYLSLGSNVGDREHHLCHAIERLEQVGRVAAVSSLYETEPVEFTEQAWFLNCAVALDTTKTPQELMAALLALEQASGRQRTQRKGPRTIDIDILLFGETVLNSPGLTVPHPGMHERRFVLEPLAEIAPEARHPALKKTIRELLAELPQGQAVRKFKTK
jgi:2-amino-4-hydroxy-6-hydroxymethyldihydropteridine diphosphokinase